MSAKALAFATGCAAIGVPTFDVIARQAEVAGLELEVIADAQQERLFVQPFARSQAANPFVSAGELTVLAGQVWAARRRHDVAVTGPGLCVAERWLAANSPVARPDQRVPSSASLLAVGWERFQRGLRDGALPLEPIYVRRSSAEQQWDRRPGR
jgi:tRNA threonylcarbamoyladenosine biosynthesis protein TsaB